MRTPIAAVAALFLILGGTAVAEPLKITVTRPDFLSNRVEWMKEQVRCVRNAVFTEARGESDLGQRMVAWVVAQRALDNRREWGRTFCDVAYRIRANPDGTLTSQFTGPVRHGVSVQEGHPDLERAERNTLRVILEDWKPEGELQLARFYQRPEHADPTRSKWFKKLVVVGKIDNHVFYRSR